MTVIVAAMLTVGGWPTPAGADERTAILVFHAYGYDTPTRTAFDAALTRSFRDGPGAGVDVYVETLDFTRFTDEAQARLMRSHLRERYGGRKIAVVVAVYDPALAFLLDQRDPLFPEVPIAALLHRSPSPGSERVAVIREGNTLGETAALALTLQPSTQQIVIIDGSPPNPGSDAQYAEASGELAEIRARVSVRFLRDLRLGEVITRVHALPPESVVIMVRQTSGFGGAAVATIDAVREIARVAPVPIYVLSDQLIGGGAVGGVVYSVERDATELARLAIRIAGDRSLPLPAIDSAMVPMFDWRQLRRWGIGTDRLPPESEVRFREVSAWDRYRWFAVGALGLLLTQSALLAGMLVHRRRHRRAEFALRHSESALRASHLHQQTLAGRLIAAQEIERARIARDLHDDLSQKLALLSIELGHVLSDANSDARVVGRVRTAAIFATDIATDVHNLSHELHPARLKTLGLGLALRSLCRELSSAHGLSIEFDCGPVPRAIPSDVALCLFRIAQEALRNVVKHSGAMAARVGLSYANGILELRVTDSGRGFSFEPHGSDGLGLVSMRERAHLVGGRIEVQSSAAGTRIDVSVPLLHDDTHQVLAAGAVRSFGQFAAATATMNTGPADDDRSGR